MFPPPKAVEEFPERVSVSPAIKLGAQSVLVTGRKAAKVRQYLPSTNAEEFFVMVADIFISLVLGKCHHCLDSEVSGSRGPCRVDGLRGGKKTRSKRIAQAASAGVELGKRLSALAFRSFSLIVTFYFFFFLILFPLSTRGPHEM